MKLYKKLDLLELQRDSDRNFDRNQRLLTAILTAKPKSVNRL
jgi:hypothetical protein